MKRWDKFRPDLLAKARAIEYSFQIMKVKFTIPARGLLRVIDNSPVIFPGWSFQFKSDKKTGFVNSITIEVADIPKEKWPTLTEIKQDPKAKIPTFPFEVNPNTFHFNEFESFIINLESYLSVFGLEALDLRYMKEEWLPDNKNEEVSMMSGWSTLKNEPSPPTAPLTHEDIARCIVASRLDKTLSVTLAHFRVGQTFFYKGKHVEAIRHLYLCLENQFANGKFRKNAVSNEFLKSAVLTSTIHDLFINIHHQQYINICKKHNLDNTSNDPSVFINFIVKLRGNIQHANKKTAKLWHPSRQSNFKNEAICLFNVAEKICFDMVINEISSIKQT